MRRTTIKLCSVLLLVGVGLAWPPNPACGCIDATWHNDGSITWHDGTKVLLDGTLKFQDGTSFKPEWWRKWYYYRYYQTPNSTFSD